MILSSHGIICSSIVQFSPQIAANAFYARVTAAGGSLTSTEESAILALVTDLVDYGLWDKMKAIYPMVGASAAACSQNLKSSSFTGTFTSGWTFASTGATPNGTSAYMDTNLNMSTYLNQNNTHVMVYSRTNITSKTVMIGATGPSLNGGCYIYPRFSNTTAYFSTFNGTGGNSTAIITSSLGFLLASRLISTQEIYYQNSSKITTNSNNSVTPVSRNVYIGANNNDGSATAFSNRETAFASIGDGLTDTEASDFYTAVQAFQTTLSRQV